MNRMHRVFVLTACVALAALAVAAADEAAKSKIPEGIFKASALNGIPFRNAKNENLGKLEDLVVNKDGKVMYGWLAYGSRLTGSAKYFAVPWDAMEMKTLTGKPTDVNFVVDVGKATLDSASGHDKDHFPSEPDRQMFKRK